MGIGVIVMLAALGVFAAPGLFALALAYVLLQGGANAAQAAFQAYLPDLIPSSARGAAPVCADSWISQARCSHSWSSVGCWARAAQAQRLRLSELR
jgi:hypothetical protein